MIVPNSLLLFVWNVASTQPNGLLYSSCSTLISHNIQNSDWLQSTRQRYFFLNVDIYCDLTRTEKNPLMQQRTKINSFEVDWILAICSPWTLLKHAPPSSRFQWSIASYWIHVAHIALSSVSFSPRCDMLIPKALLIRKLTRDRHNFSCSRRAIMMSIKFRSRKPWQSFSQCSLLSIGHFRLRATCSWWMALLRHATKSPFPECFHSTFIHLQLEFTFTPNQLNTKRHSWCLQRSEFVYFMSCSLQTWNIKGAHGSRINQSKSISTV